MTRSTARFRRVATVVPLALVSAAWTTHLAGAGPAVLGSTAAAPADRAPRTLPDGTRVPDAPIDYPASLSEPAEVTATVGPFRQVAVTPSASEIPSSALAAYQRAETVINAADASCSLSWQLIAAIGKVESDHGRFGGAALNAQGVAAPSIIGPVLDGRGGTAIIRDTDGGQYDGDAQFDRAVGPMQFIPSTWSVVGVDADNDGKRNPHDIDDAALAAAVYLCSGQENLSKNPGQRAAVYRYNHSAAYVDLVLSIMRSYFNGVYTVGPGAELSARSGDVEPLVPVGPVADELDTAAAPLENATVAGQPAPDLVGPPVPGADPVKNPVVQQPGGDPVPGTDDPSDPTDPTDPETGEPTDPGTGEPTDPGTDEPTDPGTGTPSDPGPSGMTAEEAAAYCGDEQGLVDDPEASDDAYDVCVASATAPSDGDSDEAPAAPGAAATAPKQDGE